MILITGFGPYGHTAVNPSWRVAQAVAEEGRVDNMPITAVQLPVVYAQLNDALHDLIKQHRPRVFISLGLWPGEACIRLEKMAANVLDFEIRDNAGALEQNRPVFEGDTGGFITRAPVTEICGALLDEGIPARVSYSAGSYLCNAVSYIASKHIRDMDMNTIFLFVHIPYDLEQVVAVIKETANLGLELHQRADLASMSHGVVVQAIKVIVGKLALHAAKQ